MSLQSLLRSLGVSSSSKKRSKLPKLPKMPKGLVARAKRKVAKEKRLKEIEVRKKLIASLRAKS